MSDPHRDVPGLLRLERDLLERLQGLILQSLVDHAQLPNLFGKARQTSLAGLRGMKLAQPRRLPPQHTGGGVWRSCAPARAQRTRAVVVCAHIASICRASGICGAPGEVVGCVAVEPLIVCAAAPPQPEAKARHAAARAIGPRMRRAAMRRVKSSVQAKANSLGRPSLRLNCWLRPASACRALVKSTSAWRFKVPPRVKRLMERTGIEPVTSGLQSRRSPS